MYPRVDATMNWWGYGTDVFVSGRVMERRDDDYLIGVRYEPFHETNDTILDGEYLCLLGIMIMSVHMTPLTINYSFRYISRYTPSCLMM